MPAPKNKKELQALLGVINYLGKFSTGTTDICDSLCKLTSSKVTWTWNASYQALFNKAKLLIKVDMCMKFYDDAEATLFRNRCFWSWPRCGTITDACKGTACKKDIAPDNTNLCPTALCQQKPNRCRVQVQQHRKGGPRYSTWD